MSVQVMQPDRADEILGAARAVRTAAQWLQTWRPGAPALLLHGPPGCGKNTMLKLVAAETGLEVQTLELSCCGTELTNTRLDGRRRLMVLPGADCAGSLAALTAALPTARVPVALVAHDRYAPNLRTIQKRCLLVALARPPASSLQRLLADKSGQHPARLAATAGCRDVRQALAQLRLQQPGHPDPTGDAFSSARALLGAGRRPADARLRQVQVDAGMVGLLVHENCISSSPDIRAAADAAGALSDADVLAYQHAEASAAAVCTAAEMSRQPYGAQLRFPQLLGKGSTCTRKRGALKELPAPVQDDPWTVAAMLGGLAASRRQPEAQSMARALGLDADSLHTLVEVTSLAGRAHPLSGTHKATLVKRLAKQ